MKPPLFAYARPDSLAGAFDFLEAHGDDARVLAGGQSLMATLNMRLSAPKVLVDINRIDGLSGIEIADGKLRIGAMTRHVEVENSSLVAEQAPLLAAAISQIGHPAIRNRGTVGGSIAFADPAAELPACAVALDAEIVIEGKAGQRRVAAGSFFEGLYETTLGPGELIVAVEFPAMAEGQSCAFVELARRHGDYAIIGLAVHCRFTEGVYSNVRLVYFGAGDRPILADGSAALLEGESYSDSLMERLAAALGDDLDPPGDLNASPDMRRYLAGVVAKRALAEIAGREA